MWSLEFGCTPRLKNKNLYEIFARSICLETRWLSHCGGFYVPGWPCTPQMAFAHPLSRSVERNFHRVEEIHGIIGKAWTDYALRKLQGRTSRRLGKEDASKHCFRKMPLRIYAEHNFSDVTSNSVLSKTAIFPKKEGRKREISDESARGPSLCEANV